MIATFAFLTQTASNLPSDASALESFISALERAISALEREIKALDTSSVPWERSLPWATAVVVVGLLMEFWIIWRENRDEWHAFGLGIVRLADKPSTRKYVIELVSVFFITAGVFCEFAIGLEIASINMQLRGKSAELRTRNSELRTASDQLAALLNQKTEGLKTENLKLEARIAPRRLTQTQQRAIADNCSKFKNRFVGKRIEIVSYWLDTEAFVLAEQVLGALRMKPCGMMVDETAMSIGPSTTFAMGIQVFGSNSELARDIADAIGGGDKTIAVGFTNSDPTAGAMRIVFPGAPAHEATILVGLKPFDRATANEIKRNINPRPMPNKP